jgi:predicted GH43/DUF377 family glycosyl hydrolase
MVQLMAGGAGAAAGASDSDAKSMSRWLIPQKWKKQTEGPVVSLGDPGAFDDTHIFAPCVTLENGRYFMLYPGSRGTVAERVFRLGLATSSDGVKFSKAPSHVLEFGDKRHSILTPTVLRDVDGKPIRENGKLRMWFTGVDLRDGLHRLHQTTGETMDRWDPPSPPLLDHCYGPTIVKERSGYRMWYADVAAKPWRFRHATSSDGTHWTVTEKPVMVIDQAWEAHVLVYPQVVKVDQIYAMWYGSYWFDNEDAVRWPTTAIGFAASTDGLDWRKYPRNPVLRPDAALAWETHYNTSHSLIRMADGTWRIWYAGRKQPPFVNKYFSICTATWEGPGPA